jgi:signal transduction histidine kinase
MGMHERAAQYGGRVGFDSAPGQGTRVRLVMPLGDGPE